LAGTAAQYGFRRTVARERWHYEFSGTDPGGICGGARQTSASSGEPEEPATTGECNSATLGRNVAQGTCVESSSTRTWYQCQAGQWFRGVDEQTGPYGRCTSMIGLTAAK